MDQLNKLPRWFLVLIASAFFALVMLVGNNLYADNQTTKKVAYQAKNSAETAQLQIASLSGQIQEIKNGNDRFRTEYREDQREMRELLKIR